MEQFMASHGQFIFLNDQMNVRDIVNRDNVNLENCDQEPIHIPGTIQPHGFLLALDRESLHITFCSENIISFTGSSHKQLLNKNAVHLFHPDCIDIIKECASGQPGNAVTFTTDFLNKQFIFSTHINDEGVIILESEAVTIETQDPAENQFELSRQFIGYMEDTHTLVQLCEMVAKGIKKITGYDRVMVYRFDKNYNGEVIAESKEEKLESFLGLHYPHTDIPVQARQLYIKNLLRVIVDMDYKPAPIYTIDTEGTKNLDLSYSILRSVSPIHVQYLQNMGVGGTLTISLIHKKKLWGLIACHHYGAKYLSPEIRMAARLQGHFITSQIEIRQQNEEYEISKKSRDAADQLISKKFDLNREALFQIVNDPNILFLCKAIGVSLLIDNVIYKSGITPSDEEIHMLAQHLSVVSNHTEFHTDSLIKSVPGLKTISERTPGINFFPLNENSSNCVIWYRLETISEVFWAGDPAKSIEKDKNGLSPRKSFESWKETIKNHSNPWLPYELHSSSNFINALQKQLSAIYLAEEEEKQRQLAQILKETNSELENINWISTHDLQEPLRKIQIISSFIMADENADIPSRISDKIGKINYSAGRMQTLLKDILRYTKLKDNAEAFETVSLNSLLSEVLSDMDESLKAQHATMHIDKLPTIHVVPFLIKQLFSNLIYNSLKFSDKSRTPEIKIIWAETQQNSQIDNNNFYCIKYSDNGIGFSEKYNEQIFKIFTRLHSSGKFEGSGIGLALCKKIMETNKGYITAEGREGQGATFYIYFRKGS